MRKIFVMVSLILTLCFSIVPAYAEGNTLVFGTEEWKDATNNDGTGLYWDIFRAVYESEGYIVKPMIRSYEGSINLLKAQRIDVMVGAYIDEVDNAIYPKNHFAVDIVQVVYKNNGKYKWRGVETIKGQNVGWIKGYSFDNYLPCGIPENIQISRVYDRQAAFRLLNNNRIDFFMDPMGDLKDFLYANPKFIADYKQQKILELNLYIVFSNNDKGKKLAEIFDRRFSMLQKNRDIKKLYDKYKASNFTYPSDF